MQQTIPVPERTRASNRSDETPTAAASRADRREAAAVVTGTAPRLAHLLGMGSLAVGLAFLSACNTGRGAQRMQMMPDTPSVAQSAPVDSAEEPSIGERLGRLDARMKTAPPDSLPILEAEYQRLLDEANGVEQIRTGRPDAQEPHGYTSTQRRDQSPAGSEMQGFRASELKESRETPSRPAEPKSYTSTPRRTAAAGEGTSRVSTPRRTPGAATAAKSSSRPAQARIVTPETVRASRPAQTQAATGATTTTERPMEATSSSRDRKFVNGMAAARAGHYSEAAAQLPDAVSSPPAGKKSLAHQTYGQSLEKTGNLTKAAEQYKKGSEGNEELNHKSYISYCRVLAKSGDRTRARQLLVQFIEKHPKSGQVVNARQLLQTL